MWFIWGQCTDESWNLKQYKVAGVNHWNLGLAVDESWGEKFQKVKQIFHYLTKN